MSTKRTFVASFAAFGAFVATLVLARTAHAQINVERLRSDLKDTPATATLEGSFAGRTGNVQSVVAGAAAIGAARYRRNRFFASTSADYARVAGVTAVSKSFVHFRYDYELIAWLWPEIFVQQQQDKFQRLKLRELVGLGPRFILADEEELRLAYGTAYMFEYERVEVAEGAPDKSLSLAHRWSNYVAITWQPDARARFIATAYIQPKFDDPSDFRVLFEAALTTDITKRLAVKVVGTVRHDSLPPTAVKPTDLEIKNSIVLKF